MLYTSCVFVPQYILRMFIYSPLQSLKVRLSESLNRIFCITVKRYDKPFFPNIFAKSPYIV